MSKKEEENKVTEAKKRLAELHKKFYSPKKIPMGKDPEPTFSSRILDMKYYVGEKVKFIGCCIYMNDFPLEPISGQHPEGFSTPEQHMKEINGHYRGRLCKILNISEETTDDMIYFKVLFADGIPMTVLPFEVCKQHVRIDNICQTCWAYSSGACEGNGYM